MTTPDINIYLDTTMLYNDPFFKKNFNRLLLKFADTYGVPLVMSKVVFDEARKNFLKNVEKRMSNLESALEELKDFYPQELTASTLQISCADFEQQFDNYYNQLVQLNLIEIVDYDNSILPELVHRSINRIKPFTEKKQEFRDAITWLTYTQKADRENQEYCFFITQNKKDFMDSANNLHPDLIKDSSKFKLYFTSKEFFENEEIIKPLINTVELKRWLEDNPFDQEAVLDLINLKFDEIYDYTVDFVNAAGSDVISEDDGYGELFSIDIKEVRDLNIEVISDEIIVTGSLIIDASLEVYVYNTFRERGEDNFTHVGSDDAKLEYIFTFSYHPEETIKYFEINDVYVLQSAEAFPNREDDRYEF